MKYSFTKTKSCIIMIVYGGAGKRFALLIIAAEVILLAAMLLADFGILPSRIDPLSTKSIMMHLTVVIIIVGSLIAIKRADKK